MVWKACRKFRYKNNRTTAAIGVILAFTGERMKIQKPAAALVKAYICQFLAILSKSISCDSPFNIIQHNVSHFIKTTKIVTTNYLSFVLYLHVTFRLCILYFTLFNSCRNVQLKFFDVYIQSPLMNNKGLTT
jgi:hypothetical protein